MEVRSSADMKELIVECANKIMAMQLEKKAIDEDIKEIKQEAKENGIPVGKVMKVLNSIKAKAKQSEADKIEEEIIKEYLESDSSVQGNVVELIS